MGTIEQDTPAYRVVRLWTMRGNVFWTALAGVAWFISLIDVLFLVLALWGGADQGIQILRDKAEFNAAAFGKGALTVVVLTVILLACGWVLAHRKSLREAEAERTGPAAAYASACIAAPEAMEKLSGEEVEKWFTEFRRLSPDVLIVDPRVARAIGDAPLHPKRDALTIGGVPPRLALICVVLLMIAILAFLWWNSKGWLDFAIGAVMDVALGAGTIVVMSVRQRRLGGDRTVRAGEFVHGDSRWTPDDSVMAVRRIGLGRLGWFRFTLVGKAGITHAWLRDRTGSAESLREAMALWTARRGSSAAH